VQEGGEVEGDLLDDGPHYLQTKWVLWFDSALQSGKRSGVGDWAKNMKRLSVFETIEEFWGTVHNVPPPSKLPVGCNYHLFREGILPMWEDTLNSKGGKWTYNEKRVGGVPSTTVDNLWIYSMMSLVGESFPDSNQICGAVCSLRGKADRVAVWTKDANDEDAYNKVGQTFRTALNKAVGANKTINESLLDYQPHDESLKKSLTGRKR